MIEIQTCPIPADSAIHPFIALGPVKFAGAMSARLPASVTVTPADLARATFSRPTTAMVDERTRRNSFFQRVSRSWQRPVDLEADLRPGGKFGFWRVFEVHPHEILVGNDDPLLSYRVAFRVNPPDTAIIASATRCRNVGGRLWWFLFGGAQQKLLKTALFNGVTIGARTADER